MFSDPENGAKTLLFGVARTHRVNIREYTPGTYGLIDTQKNVPSGRWDGYTMYHREKGNYLSLDCSFKILQLIQIARFAFVYCIVAEHWIIFFLGEGASVDWLPAVAIRVP